MLTYITLKFLETLLNIFHYNYINEISFYEKRYSISFYHVHLYAVKIYMRDGN